MSKRKEHGNRRRLRAYGQALVSRRVPTTSIHHFARRDDHLANARLMEALRSLWAVV